MNQPSPTEKKTGKRIVNRAEYVKRQSKRLGWNCLIVVLVFTTVEFGGAVLCSLLDEGNVLLSVCCVVMTYGFWMWSKASYKRLSTMENVTFLTRANTADLFPPDTLVRASSEPEQEQESVLLRAAADSQETLPEQLVRAAGEPELL